MGILVVVEFKLNNRAEDKWYLVDTDCGEKFNYRGRMSANYFFYGKGRNTKKDGTVFYAISPFGEDSYEYKAHLKEHPENLAIKLNMWEFYKEIGYDYKAQKWLK